MKALETVCFSSGHDLKLMASALGVNQQINISRYLRCVLFTVSRGIGAKEEEWEKLALKAKRYVTTTIIITTKIAHTISLKGFCLLN